jgi:hypothetical protein
MPIVNFRDYYVREYYANPDSGILRSGLLRSGKVRSAHYSNENGVLAILLTTTHKGPNYNIPDLTVGAVTAPQLTDIVQYLLLPMLLLVHQI